jgi:hypothetical protein
MEAEVLNEHQPMTIGEARTGPNNQDCGSCPTGRFT